MAKKVFKTQYDRETYEGCITGSESPTDPYQYTPTGLLFAQSMEAGALGKINQMNKFIYADYEDPEKDDVSPIGVYPPDIAEAYQAVRLYRKKIHESQKVYKESIDNSQKGM